MADPPFGGLTAVRYPSQGRPSDLAGPRIVSTVKINKSAALVAPIAGVFLGFLDFVWIKYVPFPFGGLGNSLAVWAVAAFLLTFYSRWKLPYAVIAAIVFLVLAVPSYYVAAALIQHDDWANAYSSAAVEWIAFGVIAGAVFGSAGMISRAASRWQAPALALPAAVLSAEAVLQLARLGGPDYTASEIIGFAGILVAAAVGVTLAIARTWQLRGLAFAYATPLTALGYLALRVTGLH
jgi:hypothetical protein